MLSDSWGCWRHALEWTLGSLDSSKVSYRNVRLFSVFQRFLERFLKGFLIRQGIYGLSDRSLRFVC